MIKFILIFYMHTSSSDEVCRIDGILGGLHGVMSWTQGMEDCDQVLRIVSATDVSRKIKEIFDSASIISELMAVYLGNSEDSSMLDGVPSNHFRKQVASKKNGNTDCR